MIDYKSFEESSATPKEPVIDKGYLIGSGIVSNPKLFIVSEPTKKVIAIENLKYCETAELAGMAEASKNFATEEQMMEASIRYMNSPEYKRSNRWYRKAWRLMKAKTVDVLLWVASKISGEKYIEDWRNG